MKSKLSIQSFLFAAAMFIPLLSSASPALMDHSFIYHLQADDMHYDTAQETQGVHQQHGDSGTAEHMNHSDSAHHAASEQHHNHDSKREDEKTKTTHEHAGHQMQEQHDAMKSGGTKMIPTPLQKLKQMPVSGKSREAGFDGRYVMESTSADAALATRCAQASRGLIMVDNATWAKCGGKPEGWSMGIGNNQPMDHSGHMGH